MSRVLALFLSICPIFTLANTCDKVAEGYEISDEMYVVCSDLSHLALNEANATLKNIFEQYEGEPDEILVYFVSDEKLVGIAEDKLKPEEFVGRYYTHNSTLTIWPNIPVKRKELQLKWW
ncbi:hypothetical protein [Pleionea litopenaei]|uniref:Uncharacterized protein n=1 Tax=Pleionea litopenaei TaxID=3070815 RepID=A0AA51RVI6_9GAMM|nr:hypothetical protein [Pleionea sp. HL-JVS1]WMS88382.1 hypothetical protein Q9312_05570 [Pleionea sp. HL-JVS1]